MSIAQAILNAEGGGAPEEELEAGAAAGLEPASYDFDADFQAKIVALQLRDSAFAARTEGLVDPSYFESEVDGAIVKIALDYHRAYKRAPEWGVLGQLLRQLVFKKTLRQDMLGQIVPRLNELKAIDIADRDYVVDQVADFAKNRAIEGAMMRSIGLLERKDYAGIQKLMTAAMLVGSNEAEGDYDYWQEIAGRTKVRDDEAAGLVVRRGITTGVAELDEVLYHRGWGRKELSVLMGAAKAGKSMALGDFGKAASLAGFNVLYCSCEVSRDIIAQRTDANVAGVAMKLLGAGRGKVEDAVIRLGQKAGAFEIREFGTGTLTCSQLRRILGRYRSRGIKFDLIISDYADIMAPEFRQEDERFNSKQVYEGLRNIAFEEDAAVLTATQSNREGAKAVVAKGTHVAEDFNKVRTADVFITINATDAERAAGEARLYFSEMRNSEGGFALQIRQEREMMRFISKVLGRV